MALLRAQNLRLSFSDRLLFENISFDVENRDKIGFIGANGVGKTTIFKILSGQLQPAQGDVFVAKDIQIGYMEQHAGVEKDRTVYSELLSVFSHFEKMEQELELLAAQIEKNGKDIDTLVARQLSLQEQYENNGGLTYKRPHAGRSFGAWLYRGRHAQTGFNAFRRPAFQAEPCKTALVWRQSSAFG